MPWAGGKFSLVLKLYRVGNRRWNNFHLLLLLTVSFITFSSRFILIFVLNWSQVSEKRWYWLKVFALATIRDWDALEKFSKEKRPPIGNVSDSCFVFR